jgi:hypothetical protein
VRALRWMIVVATVLTLPGYGVAGVAFVRGCTTSESLSQMPGSEVPQNVSQSGCCDHGSDQQLPCHHPEKHHAGDPCKGSGCQASVSPGAPPPPTMFLGTAARDAVIARPITFVLLPSQNGLWRPPRPI